MTVASRLISGSAASWARITVTLISQLALVPIYLSHWSVEVFGVWVAIQAFVSILSTLDFGNQTYLEFEFLKLGPQQREKLRLYFWSGAGIGFLISSIQLLIILIVHQLGLIPILLGQAKIRDAELIRSATIVLFIEGSLWLLLKSFGGLMVRVLAPFGYYPRTAWWGVFDALIGSLFPAIVVLSGGDLLAAGVAAAAGSLFANAFIYRDLILLLKKEFLWITRPSVRLGFSNFLNSISLSGKSVLENIRQQGVRLVLAPLSGATGLAAFATMRTGANVALQGLNTITSPLMPELMRFLGQRDQARSEAAFGTVWIFLVAMLAPAVVILQILIQPVFVIWTQGKIPFDSALFATLSQGALVYALAQPAISVVRGNNLLRVQLGLSALAAVIVIGGMVILIPVLGILGAGVALLAAEIVTAYGFHFYANRWMTKNDLRWPSLMDKLSLISVLIAGGSLVFIVYIPEYAFLVAGLSLLLFAWNFRQFWKALPTLVTHRLKGYIQRAG